MREFLRRWPENAFWWMVNFVAGAAVTGAVVAVHLWL